MVGFVAAICIGVIAVPTVPVTSGAACNGALTTGTATGLIVKFSVNAALVPAALLALSIVANDPLVLGEPLIAPVDVFSVSPGGKTDGATTAKPVNTGLLAVIWYTTAEGALTLRVTLAALVIVWQVWGAFRDKPSKTAEILRA